MSFPTNFEFATAGRVVFGEGVFAKVASLAKPFGKKALLVTGTSARHSRKLIELLAEAQIQATSYSVSGEPSIETIQDGLKLSKTTGCEFVLSAGGGSVLDAGKAIAALLTNSGELLDYLEVVGKGKPLEAASAPFMAIPTTAGTGSEATRNAVLSSPQHMIKASLRSPFMLPRMAIIDPELTYDLPPALTASTGMDALTQVIEPFVCSRTNPMTDALCIEGISRAGRSLRAAYRSGHDKAARQDMSVASLFGGMALANAGLGGVHGFAGPIGGMFPAPHGAICAILLPEIMTANVRALRARSPANQALNRYDQIAAILTGDTKAEAESGIDWVRKTIAEFQIPRLGTYGITAANTDILVRNAMQSSSMKANPIPLTPDELAESLEKAI